MSNKGGFKNFGQRTLPPGTIQQKPIPIESLSQIECECGSITFVSVMHLRFASKLMSPTGQPHIVQVPQGWSCVECGGLNQFKKKFEYRELFPNDDIQPDPDPDLPLVS